MTQALYAHMNKIKIKKMLSKQKKVYENIPKCMGWEWALGPDQLPLWEFCASY
jgi:hypothetical protein